MKLDKKIYYYYLIGLLVFTIDLVFAKHFPMFTPTSKIYFNLDLFVFMIPFLVVFVKSHRISITYIAVFGFLYDFILDDVLLINLTIFIGIYFTAQFFFNIFHSNFVSVLSMSFASVVVYEVIIFLIYFLMGIIPSYIYLQKIINGLLGTIVIYFFFAWAFYKLFKRLKID